MRKFLTIAILLAAGGALFARGGVQPFVRPVQEPVNETRAAARQQRPAPEQTESEGEKRLIDFKSDLMAPIAPGDSAIYMVRNFAAQHNGAVITCDSAVRYSPMHVEFFGNVLINKNTTYIYGDRAEYDGTINEARVYSELVKVIDGDATLYALDFRFDTKENVGRFDRGGVLTNRDNLLEAVRGYYYADTKELVAVDEVEMRNDEYELTGDSVVYNMATDNAYFFERTNIWNSSGDYLYADRGEYQKQDTLYIVTQNGYVLTEKQEMWSDSIDYYRLREHFILRRDLQLDDTEHKVLAFGDYGEYWKGAGNALLTRKPAVVSYDTEQGDSLFMRSDTIWLHTVNSEAEKRAAARAEREKAYADSLAAAQKAAEREAMAAKRPSAPTPSAPNPPAPTPDGSAPDMPVPDSGGVEADVPADTVAGNDGPVAGAFDGKARAEQRGMVPPAERMASAKGAGTEPSSSVADSTASGEIPELSTPSAVDSVTIDSIGAVIPADSTAAAADTLTAAQKRAIAKEEARNARREKKIALRKAREAKLDSIGRARRDKAAAKLMEMEERAHAKAEARRKKAAERLRLRQERAKAKGKAFKGDLTVLNDYEEQMRRAVKEMDSLFIEMDKEWREDSIALRGLPKADSLDSVAVVVPDSISRRILGYRNVRMYRTDFQSVCDSMVVISKDSTIHLYIEPVLWNEANQITSEHVDVYTANEQLLRAEFVGAPIMASEVDTVHYDQIAGKEMTAHFRNNEIYRNDVKGNVQTIYYQQDGDPAEATGVSFIESGDASFDIEDSKVIFITYRQSPTWYITPIDQIPENRKLLLEGFKWQNERRPSQKDVFSGRVRPTRREEIGNKRHPDFPINRRLEAMRERLIEAGTWSDRIELVDPETVDWMRSLGFEPGQPHPERR